MHAGRQTNGAGDYRTCANGIFGSAVGRLFQIIIRMVHFHLEELTHFIGADSGSFLLFIYLHETPRVHNTSTTQTHTNTPRIPKTYAAIEQVTTHVTYDTVQ